MSIYNCCCKRDCVLTAVIAAVIVGIVTAFLQITGTITVTTVFPWAALGIAVVYLGALLVSAVIARRTECNTCIAGSIEAVLTGILGTILFAAILLAVGIVATSVINAILVGILAAAMTLTFAGIACFVKCLIGCNR